MIGKVFRIVLVLTVPLSARASKGAGPLCPGGLVETRAEILPPPLSEEHAAAHERLVAHLRELQKKPVVETRQKRGDYEADFISVDGVPAHAEFIEGATLGWLRHYSNVASKIIDSKVLRAGPRAYISPLAHEIRYYNDLTGVMVTTIKCAPEALMMGLKAATVGFVDFKLPPGVTVLKLDKCNFLIPGNPNTPQWILDAYRSNKPSPSLSGPFRRLKEAGNLIDPLEIPLLIKYSRSETNIP